MPIPSIFVYLCAIAMAMTEFCACTPRAAIAADAPDKPVEKLDALLKKQRYTAIPLIQTTDRGQYLVKVKLDGKPMTLLIDTGADSDIFVSKDAGKKLGIESDTFSGKKTFGTGISSDKMGVGSVNEVSVLHGKGEYKVTEKHTVYALEGFSCQAGVRNAETGKDEPVTVEGLLGQKFLQAHCAIIDNESSTLFLIPLLTRELPKLSARWECVRGERDGSPVENVKSNWIAIQSDGATEFALLDKKSTGYLQLHRAGVLRIFYVGSQDERGISKTHCRGIYSVESDTLKLALIDETSKKGLDPRSADQPFPFRLEAKTDSGHAYFEFVRKPLDKTKK